MLRSFRPHGVADGLLLGFVRDEHAALIATFAGPGPGVPFQQQGDLCELQCRGVKRGDLGKNLFIMLCLWIWCGACAVVEQVVERLRKMAVSY